MRDAQSDPAPAIKALSDEAAVIQAEAEYLAERHDTHGARWRYAAIILGTPAIVLASLLAGSAGLLALLDFDTRLIVTLSFASAAVGVLRALLRPDAQADAHSLKAKKYLSLRDDTRRYRQIDLPGGGSGIDNLRYELARLGDRLSDLREAEPREHPAILFRKR